MQNPIKKVSFVIICIVMFTSCKKTDHIKINNKSLSSKLNVDYKYIEANFERYDSIFIHNLNTSSICYKSTASNGRGIQVFLDHNSNSLFAGFTNRWNYPTYTYHVKFDFHPLLVYSNDFKYIENFVNSSDILNKRLLSYSEMDSLFLYSSLYFETKKNITKISELNEIKTGFYERTNNLKYENRIKKYILEYIDDGIYFFEKRLNQATKLSFIYYLNDDKLILFEFNQGCDIKINNYYFYNLNVFQLSLNSPNLDKLLKENFGNDYDN